MAAAPAWCNTKGLRYYWQNPHKVPLHPLKARRFKWRCWRHGLLSPNYWRREAASKDGKAIPFHRRFAAQRQALHLERVRHECGDKPMPVLSWYRSPSHNRTVGGASLSQHIKARGSDIEEAVRLRLGGAEFDAACHRVFANGGIGTQGSHGGPVRHVDSRRGAARWVY